jgi:ABC-2 type transport system permease protein
MSRLLRQVRDATIMSLRQVMRELGLLIAFGIVFPLGFLFFLGQIVRHDLLIQVVAGSIMLEMGLVNINVIAQSIGGDKQTKIYDLWVSLPMNPTVYVLSLALSLLPMTFVSAAITLIAGISLFHLSIPLTLLPALFGGFLLIWASTLGIGFLIGVYGGSPRQINQIAQFVGIVMTFFAPIFYPVSVLPQVARYVAYLWPLTWGASLLSAVLSSSYAAIALASVILAGFTGLWFVLIAVGLRWRQV